MPPQPKPAPCPRYAGAPCQGLAALCRVVNTRPCRPKGSVMGLLTLQLLQAAAANGRDWRKQHSGC